MTRHIGIIRKRFRNSDFPVFTITDVKVALGKSRIHEGYIRVLMNYMVKRGELRRISRGIYTFHVDAAVVGFAYRPFYYGMEDALSYLDLWNQATNPIIMTASGVREGMRRFDGANYTVKRISPKFFFGFTFIKHYEFWIPVSDREKTLIDLLYYGHGIREEALDALVEGINEERLDEYLKSYGRAFRKRVYRQIRLAKKAIEAKA